MVKVLAKQDIYRMLFDSASEGLVVTNANGEILLFNTRLLEIFLYQEKDLVGKPIEVLIPSRHRNEHMRQRHHFAKAPESRKMGAGRDLTGLRQDGTEFPIEVSLNNIEIEDEKFFMALVTDISQRKIIENKIHDLNRDLEKRVEQRTAALEESQELYALIAKNYPKGSINVLDENLVCVFAEGENAERDSKALGGPVGLIFTSRYPENQQNYIENNLKTVFTGISNSFDVIGENEFYKLNAVPLTNKFGRISRILVVERDVTEEKRYEQEIQKALEREKELNELKGRFVSMASHEFRTPLSTILSSATLASKYQSTADFEKQSKHLDRIKSSVTHLTNILNDFLSLSKLEEGMVILRPETVQFKEYFENLRNEMQEITKDGQVLKLMMNLDTEKGIIDPMLFKNTCINLISNAIKYSNEDTEIDLMVQAQPASLVFSVKDKGIGIPEKEQRNLFERFFRAQNAMNIQGTGLGLNIIKRYVEMMDGVIIFSSKEGVGSIFTVEIPYLNNSEA